MNLNTCFMVFGYESIVARDLDPRRRVKKRSWRCCSYTGHVSKKWCTILYASLQAGHIGESVHFILNRCLLKGAWPVHSWINRVECFRDMLLAIFW